MYKLLKRDFLFSIIVYSFLFINVYCINDDNFQNIKITPNTHCYSVLDGNCLSTFRIRWENMNFAALQFTEISSFFGLKYCPDVRNEVSTNITNSLRTFKKNIVENKPYILCDVTFIENENIYTKRGLKLVYQDVFDLFKIHITDSTNLFFPNRKFWLEFPLTEKSYLIPKGKDEIVVETIKESAPHYTQDRCKIDQNNVPCLITDIYFSRQ